MKSYIDATKLKYFNKKVKSRLTNVFLFGILGKVKRP